MHEPVAAGSASPRSIHAKPHGIAEIPHGDATRRQEPRVLAAALWVLGFVPFLALIPAIVKLRFPKTRDEPLAPDTYGWLLVGGEVAVSICLVTIVAYALMARVPSKGSVRSRLGWAAFISAMALIVIMASGALLMIGWLVYCVLTGGAEMVGRERL